jgi:hypothetical protein
VQRVRNATKQNVIKEYVSTIENLRLLKVENEEVNKEIKTKTDNIQFEKQKNEIYRNETNNSAAGVLQLISEGNLQFSATQITKLLEILTLGKSEKGILRSFVLETSKKPTNFTQKCSSNLIMLVKWAERLTEAGSKIKRYADIGNNSKELTDNIKKQIDSEQKKYIQRLQSISDKYISTPENCNAVDISLLELGNIRKQVQEIEDYAVNLAEDVGGKVRVYVRIRDEPGHESGTENNYETSYFNSNIIVENKSVELIFNTIGNNDLKEDDEKQKKQCKDNARGKIGPFFDVFPMTAVTQEVFSGTPNADDNSYLTLYEPGTMNLNDIGRRFRGGVYKTIAQIEDGYSVIMSGYGINGSGKTYSLFGNNNSDDMSQHDGLMFYALKNISNVETYEVESVFEEIDAGTKYDDEKNMVLKGTLIYLFGQKIDEIRKYFIGKIITNEAVKDMRKEFKEKLNLENNSYEIFSDSDKMFSDLKKLLKEIYEFRQYEKNRCHLYIVMKITFKQLNNMPKKVGFLTFIDQAGKQNPFDVNRQLFNKRSLSVSIQEENKTVSRALYIADSLYNLKMFYQSKSGEKTPAYIYKYSKLALPESAPESARKSDRDLQQMRINNKQKEKMFLNSSYTNIGKLLKNVEFIGTIISKNIEHKYTIDKNNEIYNPIHSSSRVLTIPIMQYLNDLNLEYVDETKYRPSKFVVILAIRTGSKFCMDTKETLDFW